MHLLFDGRLRRHECLALLMLAVTLSFLAHAFSQSAAAQSQPQARDARVGGDSVRTRFVADLSKEVDFTIRTLPDPYRVIIDLGDVNFQMPSGLGSNGRGLISAFRFGNFAQGKSRIVIDVSEPVTVEKAFVRPAEKNQPARLVVDLVKTTRADYLKKYREMLAAEKKAAPAAGWEPSDALALPEPESAPKNKASKPVIIIDPGHGGIDPGTNTPEGILEKAVVLAFCAELKKKLEATGRFKVLMTRESDIFVPLADRVATARRAQGDLFISIHADAIDAKHPLLGAKGPQVAQEVRGASIYTLNQQASDAEAQASAARENLSDIVAGFEEKKGSANEVTNILADLVQRASKNDAREFSNTLVSHLKGKTPLNAKTQRFANFTVLKAPDVPSVLVELGYLSNAEDQKQLISTEWREAVSGAMAQAVTSFFSTAQGRLPF